MWYGLMPNMPEERLKLLMESFHEVAQEHALFKFLLGMANMRG